MRRRLAALVALTAASVAVAAQDFVEVRLVEVEVRVTSPDGEPLPGLTRTDFTLRENGVLHDVAAVQYVPKVEPLTTVNERPDGEPELEQVPVLAPPTWVYVATEVQPVDVPRVERALRAFLLEELPPGFRVSLGGRPFTQERSELLDTLAWLVRNPNGKDGRPGLTNLTDIFVEDAAEQRATLAEARRQENGIAQMTEFMSIGDRSEIDPSLARPYITEGQLNRQIPVYGDLTLVQYFELVERLAELPGKKVVVLMRPGLRLHPENQGLLHDLAGFAARRRVSFYTVDCRGLEGSPLISDRFVPFFADPRRRPSEPDPLGELEMRRLARSGLEDLARETGGRALIGTNRLADVFQVVEEDASGYYVLSYYPVDLSAQGKFRKIEIETTRPDVRIKQATRGYYEPRPRSMFDGGRDKESLVLRRAMQSEHPPDDLPASASVAFFASPEGWPVLVLGAGVPASQVTPAKGSTERSLSVKAMVRISDKHGTRLPMYFERTLSAELTPEQWEQVRQDRSAFISMSDMLPLLPGEYDWRVVFRDEKSGRLGGLQGSVTLRDFRGPSTPSTLLLTREVARREDAASAGEPAIEPLDAGALRFLPQPSPVFKQGETVHLLYALYNATQADVAAAQKGMQLALFHNGRAITNVEAGGGPVVDQETGTIRFTGFIKTGTLAPGTYTVMALLPNAESRPDPHLQQMFVILPPDA